MLDKLIKPFKLVSMAILAATTSCVKSNPQTDNGERKQAKASIYDITVETLNNEPLNLSKLKGKKILVVNVASECGFTPQYKQLQMLHERLKDKVTILGFPCNDFGGQEPGTEKEIGEFCQKNYGVTFQMMSKTSIKGENISPIYKWLTDKNLNGWNDKSPSWNFCKYLIAEDGTLLHFFGSGIDPLSNEIIEAIEK